MSSSIPSYEPVAPVSLVAEKESNRLTIQWSDGLTTEYPIEWLRWQCPCALCKGEMGVPGRLSQIDKLSSLETQLDDAQPVGRYGIMLFWGDGHHDGIYTYDWLRENSQPPAASANEDASSTT